MRVKQARHAPVAAPQAVPHTPQAHTPQAGRARDAAASPAVQRLGLLQRTADDAAHSRALAQPAPSGGVAQRYTLLRGDPEKRISGGQRIARTGKKSLYADAGLVADANTRLEATASYARLASDGSREFITNDDGDSIPGVSLTWNPRVDDRSFMQAASVRNAAGGAYETFADCHRNAQTVMGSTQTEGIDTEKPVLRDAQGGETTLDPMSAQGARDVGAANKDTANRGAYSVFDRILPDIATRLTALGKPILAALAAVDDTAATPIAYKQAKQWTAYAEVYRTPVLRTAFGLLSGSNEFAKPEVGEALTIISGTMAKGSFHNRATYDDLVARLGQGAVDALTITPDDTFAALWTKLEAASDAQKSTLAKTHLLARLQANAAVLAGLSVADTILAALQDGGTSLEAVIATLTPRDITALAGPGLLDLGFTAPQRRDLTPDQFPADIAGNAGAFADMARGAALSTVRQPWNFHWAGVVLKDGGDYVTLENLSVEDPGTINGAWYFQMFGTEQADQTFHHQYAATGEFGDAALTLNYQQVT